MQRREFILFLGGATVARPPAVRARQPAAMPVVGLLNGAIAEQYARFAREFRRGPEGNERGHAMSLEQVMRELKARWANLARF